MRPPTDSDHSNLNPKLRHAGLDLHRRTPLIPETLAENICRGDRVALARAITLLESSLPEHRETVAQILEMCMPCRVPSFRVGITGSPGVGKSTFIEAFGMYAGTQGSKIAVLAVDPSSRLSRGSILGDKTRMTTLSSSEFAFIRPSPAGESLGGVAKMTRDTILLCEAAGYDLILVETVGVGQSEMAVHSMTDFFLLLLLPGAGDELQGIKRGIVEMADLLVVNKADGERLPLARRARGEYLNALHLFPPKENGWSPQVLTCSAAENTGIEEVWNSMQAFRSHTAANDSMEQRRRQQALAAMEEQLQSALRELFLHHPVVRDQLPAIEQEVLSGHISPAKAAHILLTFFLNQNVSP